MCADLVCQLYRLTMQRVRYNIAYDCFTADNLDDPDSFPRLGRSSGRSRLRHPHPIDKYMRQLRIPPL